jgi:hypothetical protein
LNYLLESCRSYCIFNKKYISKRGGSRTAIRGTTYGATIVKRENFIMRTNRRKFITTALGGGLATGWSRWCSGSETRNPSSVANKPVYAQLDEILKKPVLI